MADPIDALVEGCRRGQPAAQRALYERLGSRLMGVCLRYCPSREEAEDALARSVPGGARVSVVVIRTTEGKLYYGRQDDIVQPGRSFSPPPA